MKNISATDAIVDFHFILNMFIIGTYLHPLLYLALCVIVWDTWVMLTRLRHLSHHTNTQMWMSLCGHCVCSSKDTSVSQRQLNT